MQDKLATAQYWHRNGQFELAARMASAAQVRTPLYQQSVGRWKHYERELADLLSRLPHGAQNDSSNVIPIPP